MTTPHTSTPRKPPRPRWWRWLTQFSLRSLLIVTTLTAIGCWWFLRPELRDEELAGKALQLRRQVRIDRVPNSESLPLTVNIGAWRVRDEHGDLLIDGRYADDQPHGKWTIYHVNGQKAAEGQVFSGARTGLWRTWDEEGRLRSEATYKAVVRRERTPGPTRPYTLVPVVGMINLLGQFGGGGGMMGGGLGAGFGPAYPPPLPVWETTHVAVRHGPIKVWYASGTLQLEGAFLDDQRDGLWTHYDQQGQILEQGHYRDGLREGAWHERDAPPAQTAEQLYLSGLPQAEHAALLAQLESDLADGNTSRKIAAAQQLSSLGPPGIARLTAALQSDNQEVQLLALRELSQQAELRSETMALIAPLADHVEPRIALRARLALYVARPDERSRLLVQIAAALEKSDDALALEGLWAAYRADPERQVAVLGLLVERMGRIEAEYRGGWSQHRPDYIAQVADLGWDVIPQLETIYPESGTEGRWFAVRVLQTLVARDKPVITETAGGGREVRWPVPEQGQPLLERAQADADPRVKQAAEGVGRQNSPSGTGFGSGFGGPAGGFF
jgi:hypothetical protein